ncbi:MDR family MFS transporter [Lentilactobacillus kisonensis]|uniref:Transporter, major facilitator family protein n=1 Tax=Lentilactobacillus kisonensis DSM 19906 = JCM 15041 TaxID=1423766 RepID=A0A0R1NTF8_9LACO|nr:MDR family MFS transporter [Lentilactobacillus kisonensis]KRL23584.1 transporter, major facilitator family protein [Lentilactobacillus kisonensis DSM 19906 = JCM 15041]
MTNTAKKSNVALVTIALFVATFMAAIEGTIVSTAMPTIVGDLHGVALMNWVFSIFLLTNAIATPIYGKLADSIGRKPMFIGGIAIFIFGSVMSGLSHSMVVLIIWRAIQGIGAGSILPISNTIIADIYPLEKRAQVLGLNSSAWGIASVIAPLLGGFIVDQLSWHWIFFINLPIGLIVMVMVQLYLHEEKRSVKSRMDIGGTWWLTIMLLAVMYAFQLLGQSPIQWQIVAACFLITVIALVMFIRRERIAADPLIPMELFDNRTFVIQNMVAFLVCGFLIGYEVYLPDWTQGILGLRASMAGFAITPSSLMWIVGSFIAGKLLVRTTPHNIINLSLFFVLVGGVIMVLIPDYTPFTAFLLISVICGTGFGLTVTTSMISVQNTVKPTEIGVATSFNTLARTLGQTLMISIFGIVMNTTMLRGVRQTDGTTLKMMDKLINPMTVDQLNANVLPKLRTILYQSLHNVFIVALLLILVAFVVNFAGRKKKNQRID